MDILQTRNPTWGFYGAFSHHATTDSSVAWPRASEAIAKETGCTAEDVRSFLDSTKGRLFAEGVIEELKSTNALKTALDAAVTKLRRHKIRSEDGSDGLPYLKAFACDCKLDKETSEV
jgi:hypothetical protein